MLPDPIDIQVAGPVALAQATALAKARAQALKPEAMLLAWFDQATGEYAPQIPG